MSKFLYILFFLISIDSLNAKEVQKLVWPSPPDEAKIEYLSSVRSPEEFGIEKGFFSRAFDFLFDVGETSLSAPFGLHSDKGRLYITDISSKSIYIFDKKEDETITVEGSDDENFLYPIDVVTDVDGNIFVSDSVRAKIYVFEKDGDFSYSISNRVIQRPIGIAISKDNKKLYVVDSVASKIHILTPKGKFIKSVGKKGFNDGEFNRPTFIDIGKDGKIYVTDSMNHRVQILDSDGKFINKFGHIGQEIGSFGSPRGISLDSYENIYVSDTMYNTIQIFNNSGELLMVFGNYGNNKGEFALAEDISITDDNTIYISDTNNRRVQVFKLLDSTAVRSAK
jgi:DNA-binding beta-propeller fold protein YncE